MTTNFDEGFNSAAVRLSQDYLAQIVPGDDPGKIVDALRHCMGVEAGLLLVVNGQTLSMTQTTLRMPQPVLEAWVQTQPADLKRSLVPSIESNPGAFWSNRDAFTEKFRDDLEVLQMLGQFGLGEGAGLKLLRQPLPDGSEDHMVIALLTGRGTRFPLSITKISRELTPSLQDAIFRLNLPFTIERSIHAQIAETDEAGFVCLGDDDDGIIELNQRAYELALKYGAAVGLTSIRYMMRDFVELARVNTKTRKVWQIVHPSGRTTLQVRAYTMPKERFMLPRNLPILKFEEMDFPQMPTPADDFSVFARLRPREREVAIRLVTTGDSPQEIAFEWKISEKTIRKHIENIHDALGVHSRGELSALVRNSRS